MSGERVLLTGATGFLGMEILRRIITRDDGSRAFVLVRTAGGKTPNERIDALVEKMFGKDAAAARARIDVVEGDIDVPRLSLDEVVYDELAKQITRVVHCAATIRFDLPLDEARKTNVGGTEHALKLALRAKELGSLKRFDYVGTAYVAGRRRGVILESELDCNQAFSNSYERTKLEAETVVRRHMDQLDVTIFRPSIIVGDSKTGAASSFHGMYQPMSLFARGLILCVPGDLSTPVDLVPVDYVANAIEYLMKTPASIGKCYHLTAGRDRVLRLGQITEMVSKHFGRKMPPVMPKATYERFVQPALRLALWGKKRRAMFKGEMYLPYISADLWFDNANAAMDLVGSGIEAQPVEAYFERLLAFYDTEDARRRAAR